MRSSRNVRDPRNANRATVATIVAIGMLAVGACSSTTSGIPTVASGTASTTASADQAQSWDLGHGLRLAAPAGTTVTPFTSGSNDCTTARATVQTAGGQFELQLVGTDCPQDDQRALNGNHGSYLEPPDHASEVSSPATVPIGSLVTFQQTYTECTNSCTDYTDHVGLVTLSSPADPDLPVLMVLAPRKAEDGTAAVTALVQALSTA